MRAASGPLLPVVALLAVLAPLSTAAPFEGEEPLLVSFLGDLVMSVDGWSIYDCINEITGGDPAQYRLMGTPTHDLFVEKYGDVFHERAGLPTQVVPFERGGPVSNEVPLQGGENILGVLPGRDLAKWVVIGGHYDTREFTFGGGALDNTSGICTVLELAKALSEQFVGHGIQPEATLVFAWWDGEEWGLYGARAFLDDHNETKRLLGLDPNVPVDIVAAVSFDMVGLNYPAYNTWVRYGDPQQILETAVLNIRTSPVDPANFTLCPSYGCYKYENYSEAQLANFTNYRALVEEVAYEFLEFPRQYVWVYDDEYGRSDHVPFIARGIPGMRVQGSHDEEYPHYHQPTDTLPALVALAGSETHLRAGFDKAADVGAVTFGYIAAKGNVGTFGTGAAETQPQNQPPAPPGNDTPGLDGIALLGLAAAALLLGRRR